MRSSIKVVEYNQDFYMRKNDFCSFLLIKLFTVVIITVVRSGRYKRLRMCSGLGFYSRCKNIQRQPQTFIFSPHR